MTLGRVLTVAGLMALLLVPGPLGAQERYMRERKLTIQSNINQALPEARRGLQLLQSAGGNGEQILRASEAIFASYKLLRSAQESSETVLAHSAFPDPIMQIRNARIQKIRDRLRFCHDADGLMVKQDSETTAECLKGLVEAVRNLEIVVETMN
ncbi:MAG: hypothetical protein ACHQ7H_00685 [Candidatus Rokuibacteriota bacterium]